MSMSGNLFATESAQWVCPNNSMAESAMKFGGYGPASFDNIRSSFLYWVGSRSWSTNTLVF
jgi:hypothetical protein